MSLANHSARGKSLWLQPQPSAKTEVYLLYPSVALLPKPGNRTIFNQSPSLITWLSFKKPRQYDNEHSLCSCKQKDQHHVQPKSATQELTALSYLDPMCLPFPGIALFSLFAFAGLEQLFFLPCHLSSLVWTPNLLLGLSIRKDSEWHKDVKNPSMTLRS